jgi:hypothetical protein
VAIYRSSNSNDKQPRHKPEFIYVDEQQERVKRSEMLHDARGDYYEKLQHIENFKYPALVLRLLTLVWSVIFALSALLLSAGVVFTTALAVLCLFRSAKFNAWRKKVWDFFRKSLVFSLGTFIATLSPPFGFGVIVLYFMLRGEDAEKNEFMRLINPVK